MEASFSTFTAKEGFDVHVYCMMWLYPEWLKKISYRQSSVRVWCSANWTQLRESPLTVGSESRHLGKGLQFSQAGLTVQLSTLWHKTTTKLESMVLLPAYSSLWIMDNSCFPAFCSVKFSMAQNDPIPNYKDFKTQIYCLLQGTIEIYYLHNK